MTNQLLIDRFQKHLTRKQLSDKTIKSFVATVTKFANNYNLVSCSSFDIEDYIDQMIESGNKAQTANQRISALRAFFGYIYESNIRPDNPTNSIKPISTKEKRPQYDLYTNDEYKAIFTCTRVKPCNRILVGLACFAGLRAEEITNLRLEHLDFDNLQLTVYEGKGKKTEIISMPSNLANLLKEYIEDYKITDYIINSNGKKITTNTLRYRWKTVVNELGLEHKKLHIHRHWCGSTLANNTSLTVAKNQLRHSSSRTTEMFYVHKDLNKMTLEVDNVMSNIF